MLLCIADAVATHRSRETSSTNTYKMGKKMALFFLYALQP